MSDEKIKPGPYMRSSEHPGYDWEFKAVKDPSVRQVGGTNPPIGCLVAAVLFSAVATTLVIYAPKPAPQEHFIGDYVTVIKDNREGQVTQCISNTECQVRFENNGIKYEEWFYVSKLKATEANEVITHD